MRRTNSGSGLKGSDFSFAPEPFSRQCLPFPLLGLDTDNGGEFINYELLRYGEREKITFTRSRAYRKNDQAQASAFGCAKR